MDTRMDMGMRTVVTVVTVTGMATVILTALRLPLRVRRQVQHPRQQQSLPPR